LIEYWYNVSRLPRYICINKRTASGLFIPEKAQESINQGIVIEVGPGTDDKPIVLKKGDCVLLPSFGGTTVTMQKEEYLLYNSSEILAKLEQ
jgi:chaperonin GroES